MRSSSAAVRSQTLQLRLGLPADRKSAPVEQYIPGQKAEDLKEKFSKLNLFVAARGGGWITSIPGAPEVAIECLPDSSLPAELFAAGYDLREDGEGQRISPHAITQHLTLTSSGGYEALVAGSTKAIAQTVRHAGIVKVLRFTFSI